MEGGAAVKKLSLFFAAALLVVAAGFAAAADIGFSVDNDSTFERKEKDEDAFIQKNKGLVWFTADPGENWEFKAVAGGTLSNDEDEPLFYADFQQLSLKGFYPLPAEGISLFSVEAGRFYEGEFSGRVFAHVMDGIRLELGFPDSTAHLAAGYTGLVNKYYGSILMSGADAVDDGDDDKFLGPPRLVGVFSWEFTELFGRQSLTLAAVYQMDMRGYLESNPLDELDTFYAGAGLGGPLGGRMYLALYGRYGGRDIAFYLLGGGLRWYRPDLRQGAMGLYFL
mgnify:CR=1 FL=1